ncbi:hypothetical protein RQP46_010424 [Phenoliferia psychrophenolica]
MRARLVAFLLLPLSFAVALAIPPVGAKGGPARLNNGAGSGPAGMGGMDKGNVVVAAAAAGTNNPIGGEEKSLNYLVTLSRTVTNIDKDKIFDFLMASGAVVKQVYDYRVYKGVLFSVPTTADHGLASWSARLDKLVGVKFVEEDTVVKTN